jgi:hypothetical protein
MWFWNAWIKSWFFSIHRNPPSSHSYVPVSLSICQSSGKLNEAKIFPQKISIKLNVSSWNREIFFLFELPHKLDVQCFWYFFLAHVHVGWKNYDEFIWWWDFSMKIVERKERGIFWMTWGKKITEQNLIREES